MKSQVVGRKYGRLTVIKSKGKNRLGELIWVARCLCGTEKEFQATNLAAGRTQSCGCLNRETSAIRMRKLSTKHGMNGTPTHTSWACMKQRCDDPNDAKFKDYGGRGIKYCDRWKLFVNFLADMGIRPKSTTLGRKDNDGNYCPENCEWQTASVQNSNRRPYYWKR